MRRRCPDKNKAQGIFPFAMEPSVFVDGLGGFTWFSGVTYTGLFSNATTPPLTLTGIKTAVKMLEGVNPIEKWDYVFPPELKELAEEIIDQTAAKLSTKLALGLDDFVTKCCKADAKVIEKLCAEAEICEYADYGDFLS